ncbi:MAG: AmmeMemoRadiSam system protein A [Candidatus Pacearchaeota archaeon]
MKNKNKLLKLARESIKSFLEEKKLEIPEEIKREFSEKKASFVTLKINNNLRGCIGTLFPTKELWRDVSENAINAAFKDPRFFPLTKEEFEKIKIEVSILSLPKKIDYKDIKDLKRKIKGKGVILSYSFYSATYLPQVWEEIKDEEQFLSSLCLKAGLPSNFWKTNKLEILTYEVEKISE